MLHSKVDPSCFSEVAEIKSKLASIRCNQCRLLNDARLMLRPVWNASLSPHLLIIPRDSKVTEPPLQDPRARLGCSLTANLEGESSR